GAKPKVGGRKSSSSGVNSTAGSDWRTCEAAPTPSGTGTTCRARPPVDRRALFVTAGPPFLHPRLLPAVRWCGTIAFPSSGGTLDAPSRSPDCDRPPVLRFCPGTPKAEVGEGGREGTSGEVGGGQLHPRRPRFFSGPGHGRRDHCRPPPALPAVRQGDRRVGDHPRPHQESQVDHLEEQG